MWQYDNYWIILLFRFRIDGSASIHVQHIAETIQYRSLVRKKA